MKPLETITLLDIYFSKDLFGFLVDTFEVWEAVYSLEQKQMISRINEWGYEVTDKGKCYVEAIAAIKEPVAHQVWRVQ